MARRRATSSSDDLADTDPGFASSLHPPIANEFGIPVQPRDATREFAKRSQREAVASSSEDNEDRYAQTWPEFADKHLSGRMPQIADNNILFVVVWMFWAFAACWILFQDNGNGELVSKGGLPAYVIKLFVISVIAGIVHIPIFLIRRSWEKKTRAIAVVATAVILVLMSIAASLVHSSLQSNPPGPPPPTS